MACPVIATGSGFLSGMMAYVDCQARTIGSYGYGALADPRSPVFAALTALLTIFIALHGVKLLLGAPDGRSRIIGDVVKIGIVLTLATSWPAWRIIGYDLVLDAPAEIARSVGVASGLSDQPDIIARFQALDDGIVAMTSYGTGRLTGGVAVGDAPGDSFSGIALADQFALGMGRVGFLVGALVPFGILRLGAGILLALTPLMAGLLLFGGTNGIFHGWIRGLAFCALGSLVQTLVHGVEIALLEPWLQSALGGRQSGAFTPSAPTELFVLSVVFAGVSLGLLFLIARFVFFQFPGHFFGLPGISREKGSGLSPVDRRAGSLIALPPSRAEVISDMVADAVRRERSVQTGHARELPGIPTAGGTLPSHIPAAARGEQGQSGGRIDSQRKIGRTSASAQLRDRRS